MPVLPLRRLIPRTESLRWERMLVAGTGAAAVGLQFVAQALRAWPAGPEGLGLSIRAVAVLSPACLAGGAWALSGFFFTIALLRLRASSWPDHGPIVVRLRRWIVAYEVLACGFAGLFVWVHALKELA